MLQPSSSSIKESLVAQNEDYKAKGSYFWKGKVAIKVSRDRIEYRFLRVYQNGIFLYKDEDISSLLQKIIYPEIISLTYPIIKETDAVNPQYKTIKLLYTDEAKARELEFWAKGFGQHMKIEEMNKLIKSLKNFQILNTPSEKGEDPYEISTNPTPLLITKESSPKNLQHLEQNQSYTINKRHQNSPFPIIPTFPRSIYGVVGFILGIVTAIVVIAIFSQF